MIPAEINGIILTDDCIESIKTIQEGEHSWMENILEKAIDLALDIDSPDIDSVNRLTLISEIRIIKKHIQAISNIQPLKKARHSSTIPDMLTIVNIIFVLRLIREARYELIQKVVRLHVVFRLLLLPDLVTCLLIVKLHVYS